MCASSAFVKNLLAEGHADRRSESQVAADPDNAAGNGRDKAIRKRCRNILALDAKLKRQRVRGYDVYVRTNFTDELEGDSTFARRKLLDGKWKALSEAEKTSYNAVAEAEDAEDLDHENDNFVEFLARSMEAGKKEVESVSECQAPRCPSFNSGHDRSQRVQLGDRTARI